MRSIFYTLLAFLLQVQFVQAQFSYTKLYTESVGRAYGGIVCNTADNGSLLSMGGGVFTLIKEAANGQVEWIKSYENFSSLSDFYPAFQPLDDGSVIVANGWHAMRIDAQGDVLWAKSYKGPQTNGQDITTICATDQGDFWMATASGPHKESLIQIDGNGDTLQLVAWEEPLESRNMIALTDGNFLISTSFALIKLNPQGQVLWHKRYQTASGFLFGKVLELQNGNFIVSAGNWIDLNTLALSLMEVDAQGAVVWCKVFGSLTNKAFTGWGTDLAMLDDGGYLVVGAMGEENGPDADHDAFLMRTNSQGDTLWTRRYHQTGKFSELHEIVKTQNNQLLASGFVDDITIGTHDQIILRIDSLGQGLGTCFISDTPLEVADVSSMVTVSDGTLTAKASGPQVFVTDLNVIAQHYGAITDQIECAFGEPNGIEEQALLQFSLYPNPAAATLNVDVVSADFDQTQWYITNSFGQALQTGQLNQNQSIDISKLAAGVYVFKAGKSNKWFVVE